MKWLRRIVLGALAVAAVLAIAVVVVTDTAAFRAWLLRQANAAADAALVGEVRIGGLEGSIWRDLTLRDLRVRHEGEDVVVVPSLRVAWSPRGLLARRVDVTAIEIEDPLVRAVQSADGSWGTAEALSPVPAEEPEPPEEESGGLPVTLSIPSIELRGGRAIVSTAGDTARTYEIRRLHLDAGARLAGKEVDAVVRDLSLRLVTEGAPETELVAVARFEGGEERTQIEVERLDVTTPDSAVRLTASVGDLDSLVLDAVLRVERLAAAEMKAVVPSWPLAVDVEGTLQARGSRPDLELAGELRAGGGRIGVEADADLAGDEPRYALVLALEQLDAERLLARDDLAGVLGGTVEVAGTGTELTAVTADADLEVGGLRVARAPLGRLTLAAGLRAGEATVTADLVNEGRAHLETTVGIEAERYDVRLDVSDLDLGPLAGSESAESRLELTARVRGTGFAPERMNANADVRIAPSRIGPLEIDGGTMQATVAESRVQIDALRLQASGTVLEAGGDVGLAADAPGHLELTLRVPDVGPWLKLAERSGEGSLTLTATADGPPSALEVDAHAEAAALRVGDVRIEAATLDADLSGVGSDAPAGTLRARVAGLDAGTEVTSVDARVTLAGTTPPAARVEADAVLAEGGRRQAVLADVVYDQERVVVDLARLSLELPTGEWSLARTARVAYGPAGIEVNGLRLASGDQAIEADGALPAAAGAAGLRLRVDGLDLASFEPLAGDDVGELAGILDADVQVRGSLDAPRPTGSMQLGGGRVEVVPLGVTVGEIRLDTRFTPERIEVRELSAKAGEGTLQLAGGVGLEGLQPADADLRLALTQWPAIDTERNEATVAADLRVRGPLAGPDVSGRFQVVSASLRPDVSLPGSEGPPPRDATIVVVQEREERAEDEDGGEAAGESDVFSNTAIDVEVVIDRGFWVKHERSAIELEGALDVRKPRGDADPALVGELRVVRGWIYLYGRRLEAERGVVTFTGGREIDPALDVVVRSRVDEYDVSTSIGGTASNPELDFESSPPLDDADILAVLMFGKPANELGGGEQVAVEQQAVSIASNYAASKVGQALGDAFGFQISELDVTSGRVGVGRYVTPNTYVSVTQDPSGGGAREVQVQYYATPQWTLETSTTSEGDSGADVFWQKEY